MKKVAIAAVILVVLATVALAQSPPTLRIVTDDPTLPSELFYGNVKVKPVRIRPGTNTPITIDDLDFFVSQHYIDFLSRFPEPAGFSSWMTYLNGCNGDTNCLYGPNGRRTVASSGFFGSQEFNIKGGYVFRFYRASFGQAFANLPKYVDMVAGMRAVTGQTATETNQKRAAFAANWVQRSDFNSIYGAMSNTQYVTALMNGSQGQAYNLTSITTPDPANPDNGQLMTLTTNDLINDLNAATLTRAQVLRAIADSSEIQNKEFNPSFVYMQYAGYLRRDPEEAGYNAWLTYLNTHPGDFNTMVWGFVDSQEYRNRF